MKKKLIFLALFALLLGALLAVGVHAATPTSYEMGDANMDGKVNTRDVVLIKQSIVGMTTLTEEQKYYADVYDDGTGAVNTRDAVLILQHIVGMDVELDTRATITFETNGGSAVNSIKEKPGTAITEPTAPIKTGHTFAGWYTDTACTEAYIFSIMPAQSVTLYAKWSVNSYTITFETGDGSAVAPITQNYNTVVTAPAAPTKTGYTFGGWYTDAACTKAYTISKMPAENMTLYAKWSVNSYTITFVTNGGSAVAPIMQNYNTAVTAPAAPTKTGHTFAGWYTDAACTRAYDFNTMLSKDITLYAKWTIYHKIITQENVFLQDDVEVTVTFISNDDTLRVKTIKNNQTLEYFVPYDGILGGMVFEGWYTDEKFTERFEFNCQLYSDITLYAKWITIDPVCPFYYALSFDKQNQSNSARLGTEAYYFVATDNGPATVYFRNNILGGMFGIQICLYEVGEKGAEDVMLHSQSIIHWKDMDYDELLNSYASFTFNAKQGTVYYLLVYAMGNWDCSFNAYVTGKGASRNSTCSIGHFAYREEGEDFLLPVPQKSYYSFLGWYYLDGDMEKQLTDAEGRSLPETKYLAKDIEVYAKWQPIEYTVTFKDGDTIVDEVKFTTEDKIIQEPTVPEHVGYIGDWESYYLYEQDIIVNATYKLIPYKITYHGIEGVANANPSTYTVENHVFILQDLNKEGHSFDGWYSDAAFTKKVTEIAGGTTGDIDLYAKFEINNYTIVFESNGGSFVSPITQKYGTIIAVPADSIKTGYTFLGWYSNAACTEAYIFDSMPAKNFTLYAKWHINSYTIAFESNGGSVVAPITQNYGTSVIAPQAPVKAGYTFEGWYTDVACIDAYTISKMPAENVMLYAKWNINSYTITFVSNGGSAVPAITQNYGTSLSVPATIERKGYAFGGWYTDATCTNIYTFSTMPAENVTLYAKWNAIVYNITYHLDGGKNGNNPITYSVESENIVLEDAVKAGSVFVGWYTDCGFENRISEILSGATGDVELYAKWENGFVIEENATGLTLVSYTGAAEHLVLPSTFTEIALNAFVNNTTLKSVVIPDSVETIGLSAFSGCTSLESITLPFVGATKDGTDNTHFGYIFGASSNYYNKDYIPASLNNVVITGGTHIDDRAFENCMKVISIYLPASVTQIDYGIFSGCTSLKSIVVASENPVYHSFGNCVIRTTTQSVVAGCATSVIPADGSVKSIGDCAFEYCKTLKNITIPDCVISIGDGAFKGCTGLTSITIPDDVTSIGRAAFHGCTGLKTVVFASGSKLESIGSSVFSACTGLKIVSFGENSKLKSIGSSAFDGCTGLKSITIPDSVTSIGSYAFRDCIGLIEIKIPVGVNKIDSYAFSGCYRLIEVYNASTLIIDAETSGNGNVASYAKNVYTPTIGESKLIKKDDFVFYNDNGSYYLIGYVGENATVVLPKDINGKEYALNQYAFYNCTGITSITLPNDLTAIGSSAFEGCTGLTSIAIPASVTNIGVSAFRGCTGLKSVAFGENSKLESIGVSTFSGCTGLTSIAIPDSVTSIGYSAFRDCIGLIEIKIPVGVNKIDYYAFSGCYRLIEVYNASTLIIDAEISGDGNVASYAKNVYTPTIGESKLIKKDDFVFYNDNGSYYLIGYVGENATVVLPKDINGKEYALNQYAFYNCTGITSITLPNDLTAIGSSAFEGCTGLTSIAIPASVTNIGVSAFRGCTGLISVTFDEGSKLESIGSSAFYGCTGLISVTFDKGSKLESIGSSTFYGCTGLAAVEIPDSVTSIDSFAFSGCTGLTSIEIPTSVTTIGNSAFSGCNGLMSIIIPDSVKSIGEHAFQGCGRLTEVVLGDNSQLTTIGNYAFSNCTALVSMKIPASVERIGARVFSDCKGLKTVSFASGSKMTSFSSYMFIGCTSLKNITIPDSVTSIDSSAFSGCTGLTSITIPSSVTSIGSSAFEGCTGLTEVHITDLAAWHGITFSNANANPLYYAGKLYLNGTLVTKLVLPEGTTSVNNYAFYGCMSLTSITIPQSVTSIGDYAFKNCTSLQYVTFSANSKLETIGYYAFSDCKRLSAISYNGTKAEWDAIAKERGWNYNIGSYMIQCSDKIFWQSS